MTAIFIVLFILGYVAFGMTITAALLPQMITVSHESLSQWISYRSDGWAEYPDMQPGPLRTRVMYFFVFTALLWPIGLPIWWGNLVVRKAIPNANTAAINKNVKWQEAKHKEELAKRDKEIARLEAELNPPKVAPTPVRSSFWDRWRKHDRDAFDRCDL